MKILAKPIDTIVVFKEAKRPMPYRFRVTEGDGRVMDIIVDRIFSIDERKVAGIRSYIYRCQSIVNGVEKDYELKYILDDAKWQLYKM
jgi:hypothetical protein